MIRIPARRLWAVLALTLALCLAAPALLPARTLPGLTARAATKTPKLNKTKATLYVGQTLQLKLANAKGTVTWKSSRKTVAAVSKKGKVTAKKAGSATITAIDGKKKYTCKITVKRGLTAKSTKVSLTAGASKSVEIVQKVEGKVSVKSSDARIATAKWKGTQQKGKNTLVIKGLKAGTATLTLKNADTKEALKLKVTVKPKPNKYFVLEDPADKSITAYYNPMAVLHPPYKVGVYLHTDKEPSARCRVADESVVTCEWSEWGYYAEDHNILYVYPEGEGSTTITLSNSANSETIKIKVKVVIDYSFYGY